MEYNVPAKMLNSFLYQFKSLNLTTSTLVCNYQFKHPILICSNLFNEINKNFKYLRIFNEF